MKCDYYWNKIDTNSSAVPKQKKKPVSSGWGASMSVSLTTTSTGIAYRFSVWSEYPLMLNFHVLYTLYRQFQVRKTLYEHKVINKVRKNICESQLSGTKLV